MEIFETKDYRLAAYLRARGFELWIEPDGRANGTRLNERAEVVFMFCDPERTATGAAASYPGSECQRYDALCRAMHALTQAREARRRAR